MDKFINKRCEWIFNGFHRCGYEIYAVGGCARDSILGIQPKDIDFCTNATPEQMKYVPRFIKYYSNMKVEIIPTGEKFGTLTFRFPEFDEQYEITCYRADGRYTDGRHPNEVSYARTLEEDLKRRDFTCNAIAWNPIKGYVDPFNGRQDIENKIIRCVGNPEERFSEDALRIIRLVRFALKYNFEIDEDTIRAAYKYVDKIKMVSWERIGAEFSKIFQFRLHLCHSRELRDFLLFIMKVSLGRNNEAIFYTDDFFNICIPLLRWWYIVNGVVGGDYTTNEKEMSEYINRMAVGSDICSGVKNLNKAFKFLKNSNIYWKDKKVLDIVRTPDERKALISKLIDESRDVEDIVQAIVNYEPYSIEQLAVDGNWVMNYLNMKPGPEVKKVLEDILDYVCQYPDSNTEEDIKEFLDENYKEVDNDNNS